MIMDPTEREVGHLLVALGASFEGNPRGINAGLLPSVHDLTAEQGLCGWMIGAALHTTYACGQIRYIRALQGVPTEPF